MGGGEWPVLGAGDPPLSLARDSLLWGAYISAGALALKRNATLDALDGETEKAERIASARKSRHAEAEKARRDYEEADEALFPDVSGGGGDPVDEREESDEEVTDADRLERLYDALHLAETKAQICADLASKAACEDTAFSLRAESQVWQIRARDLRSEVPLLNEELYVVSPHNHILDSAVSV